MTVLRTIEEVRSFWTPGLGFVPTMGALHDGHMALVRQSVEENRATLVSIYVNPLQFGPHEDLNRYPRPEAADIEACAKDGASAVFIPDVRTMTEGLSTSVAVSGVTRLWEGAVRPGHFEGVATIVAKLFNIVQPERAYFGWKDFQQCAVIRRLVDDLAFPIALRFVETVREPDGLAMSSRNAYLSSELRTVAPKLFATLTLASDALTRSNGQSASVASILDKSQKELLAAGFLVDYFALVDETTLEPLPELALNGRLIAAVRLGNVRLIDNIKAIIES